MAAAIEFKLFAPNNKAATLLGSFSKWEEIALEKDERGYFRTLIQLEDGIYQYKFRVQSQSPCFELDEWVEVNDPYATEIDRTTHTSTIRKPVTTATTCWRKQAFGVSTQKLL